MKITFSPPDVGEEEIREVAEALRSGWITTGPRTKKLEQMIADRVGTERCVCLNSQTACAEMALHVLGVGPGDEVIVPAYTYTASASVVCHVGAGLVLIDCGPDSFEMDYDALERAINERTKAVIPVDLGGVPCDYDRIFAIVEKKKSLFRPANAIQRALGRVAVCADTAHAFGAVRHGRPVGSIADFSAFSFHAVKNFTTAEGGALTWRTIPGIDNDEIYRRLQLFSLHGQSKDALAKSQLGAWEYDIVGPWYKCNMTDVAAAMGLAQFRRYPAMLERRRAIIERYDEAFRPLGVETLPHYTDGHASSGHLYICRVPGISPQERNDVIIRMAQAEIACNVHYKPLPMHTAYREMGFDIQDFPNAYAHFANEITLPLHTCLTDEMVDWVIENFTRIVREYGTPTDGRKDGAHV
ncbi:MAG: DegT/DnrJ/EryC1/StrS family aminotransferase [Eubacteriales bacterium]|nr:DegT/DnrJ/EryC1/StrS family aminotransferase [Eubacteriales bacterium]